MTRVVRGLCRQALDGAVRDFVLAHALAHDDSVETQLEELDALATSKDRLKFAEALDWPNLKGQTHPVTRAQGHVSDHLKKWNSASHPLRAGESEPAEPDATELEHEIKSARDACTALRTARL
ncbi:hypothetical protein GALL_335890 [mine drainage metagenome]|uniref:Uncharacterized protein n=1 Tax=mine drainage metagenome TaxID=410659 RepID=A0A1J5QXY0_9ZZZZ